MQKLRSKSIFVVPFFLNGWIDQMRVYSDVLKAQAALRRYVGYRELLAEVKRKNPQIRHTRARLNAYGEIDRTPFAGTEVYEIVVDDPRPVRRRRPRAK